jgi:hypothetical protein
LFSPRGEYARIDARQAVAKAMIVGRDGHPA